MQRLQCQLTSYVVIQGTSLEGTVGTILGVSETRDDDDRYSLSRWDFMVRRMDLRGVIPLADDN